MKLANSFHNNILYSFSPSLLIPEKNEKTKAGRKLKITASPQKSKNTFCHNFGQKTIILTQRILRPLRATISTRVDKSVILTSRAITGSPEAFNGVGLFYEK